MPLHDGLTIDFNVLGGWSEALQAVIQGGHLDVFTSYASASAAMATHSLILYQGYLKGMPLPNGAAIQHPSGNLAKHAVLTEPDFLDYRLENPEKYAEAIERGVAERDMKEMLPTAKKARRAKDGSLYLIIPFRHGSDENAVGLHGMPAQVYAMAQALKRSKVTGFHMERSGTGFIVPRANYKWGGKLTVAQLNEAGASYKDQNRYQGMYKFGNKGHSSYITFRVMSQKSKGWITPARPGLWPAKTAAEEAWALSRDGMSAALLEDLLRISGLGPED